MGSEHSSEYAIEMLHITKRFPGIIANDDVTIQLRHGEIHALLGENGAGKSTLMSVLFGLYQAEEGIIKKDGVEVDLMSDMDDLRKAAPKRTLSDIDSELLNINFFETPTTFGDI